MPLRPPFAALAHARARVLRAIEARLIDNAGPVIRRAWSMRLVYLGIAFEVADVLLGLFGAGLPDKYDHAISIFLLLAIAYCRLVPQAALKDTP